MIDLDKITAEFKKLTAEYDRMAIAVRDAGEAYDEFQEKVAKLEGQFGLFRSMYWKLQDMIKKLTSRPTNDDAAIQPPAATPPGDPKDGFSDPGQG